MNDESTNNRRLPWWVQAIITLGIMPSITIFLILVVTGFISSPPSKSVEDRAQEHRDLVRAVYSVRPEQVSLLQVICLSIVDPPNRTQCLQAPTSGAMSREP